MWLLPQYEVRFDDVKLLCAGTEEVAQLVPILLRSGHGSFEVEHLDTIGPPDKPVQTIA